MKSEKSENRSVKKTKIKLKEGFITLIKEKPVSDIKVKELCDLVDINRGTFYYHYTDIFDMLKKIEEDFFDEFINIINDIENTSIPKSDAFLILTNVFSFFDKNANLSEILLGSNGNIAFIQKLKVIVDVKVSDTWKSAGSHLSDAEYELFNSFIINGFIGLLETWLKNGRKQPPEEMATFAAKIIIPAAINTLALDNVESIS